jgi:photosystem II stability/assembly factor-like uncharacterized protein
MTSTGFLGAALRTTDGGAHWVPQPLPATTGPLAALACPTATVCETVGVVASKTVEEGVALRTNDAGRSWGRQRLPAGVSAMVALTCPSAAECYALGQTTTTTLVLRWQR